MTLDFTELMGWLAAALVLLSFSLKTMVALRVVAIFGNIAFFTYGWMAGLVPVCVLHGLLLPVNLMRLHQMRNLLQSIRKVSSGKFALTMLLPYARRLQYQAGERLFNEGDVADAMYLVLQGEVFVERISRTVKAGELVGEMGLFSEDQRRLFGAVCTSDTELGRITLPKFWEVFTQDPAFGTFVLRTVLHRNSTNSQLLRE